MTENIVKDEFPPQLKLTEEMKAKLKDIKNKLDKLKTKILKEFDKYVVGITLLPPKNLENKEERDKINVLVLIDYKEDKEKVLPYELKNKLITSINKSAEEIDKNLNPEIMFLDELKEACFDGKYEILNLIAMSAPIHDPEEMLGALKIAEVHKSMVIKKFEKYILSYVAAGSLFRGEKSKDIDVFIVVDDTDVKRMDRFELKDKLRAIILGMGMDAEEITGIKKLFHVQVYILTDFWDSVKDANPVIFTFLRDGVPLYDRGLFMPWKLLLKMGRIRPSMEAIDVQMDIGEKLLDRAKKRLLGIAAEDIYYSILNPSQAALMLYGVAPPTPRETIQLIDEIFVQKEKILEPKYVKILDRIVKFYKDVEHSKIKEVKGAEIDTLLEEAEDYLKRIKKLFEVIEKTKEQESLTEIYDGCVRITKDVLASVNITDVKISDIEKVFKENLVDTGEIPERFLKTLKEIIKIKKENKILSVAEAEKIKREARNYIRVLVEYSQRKRGIELERAKIRFKHGDQFGEALLLDNIAFITTDINAKEKEIAKAKINKQGGLEDIKKSSLEELNEVLSKKTDIIPQKVFIKEKIFEDLRNLFGRDVEILISY